MFKYAPKPVEKKPVAPIDNYGREVEVLPYGRFLDDPLHPRVTAFYSTGEPAKRGRPLAKGKKLITLRLSEDVIAKFRATGKGWQARIDEALRKAAP